MRMISKKRLRDFVERHAAAEASVMDWIGKVEMADWSRFSDVKATFRSADQLTLRSTRSVLQDAGKSASAIASKTVVIFNLGGNRFRLIASINYLTAIVYILHVLTHAEYDTNQWKSRI